MPINYTDGFRVESDILSHLRATTQLDSLSDPLKEKYHQWPIRYHLSSTRSNLLRHLNFTGLNVLEIGAGMGGISRYLAESCEFLQVIEGTQARFDALSARLRDLSNWEGTALNFQDFQSDKQFDVATLIGVLEYSPLFLDAGDNKSTFDTALKKAYQQLNPGGALIVAIENQLGLKYWNGTPEDHTNRMFDGITGYGIKPRPRTFSKRALIDLLYRNGFTTTEEFYPFPDYKMPVALLHSSAFALPPEVVSELACASQFEYYSAIRQPIFPDYLAALELARAGLLQELSNSFLFIGFKEGNNEIKRHLLKQHLQNNQQAWYYASRSNGKVLTRFQETATGNTVSKTILSPWKATSKVQWHATEEPLLEGASMKECLERAAYHGEWQPFKTELLDFMKWLIRGEHYFEGNLFLPDAIWHNARKAKEGYQLFDQEWQLASESSDDRQELTDWILFRNIITLGGINRYWKRDRPWKTLKELYLKIAKELDIQVDYERSLQKEADFQADTSGNNNVRGTAKTLNRVMTRRRMCEPYITDPINWLVTARYFAPVTPRFRFLHSIERRLRQCLRR